MVLGFSRIIRPTEITPNFLPNKVQEFIYAELLQTSLTSHNSLFNKAGQKSFPTKMGSNLAMAVKAGYR